MICDTIKELRERAGLSQSALAKKIGVTRSAVNAWEMGLSIPTTQYVAELTQLFHVSADYMLGLDNTESIYIGNLSEEGITDQPVQQPEVTQPDQTQVADTTEVEQKAWVYATETMNIRQEPNEQSAVLASAFQGSELRQLAVTANGWVKVKTGDIVGYVKSEYITTQQQ